MRSTLKVGTLTFALALILWTILELIGLVIDMSLRPMFTIVLFIMALVGITITIIAFASRNMKRANKKYKLVLWVMFEMIMVIVIISVFFLGISILPLESMTETGLRIDYFNDQEAYITTNYNFLYYR